MSKKHWKAQHKWLGLILSFFLLMFCLSGLVLNHPSLFANINVSRSLLPKTYRYNNWNGGLLRGSMSWQGKVLVYGNNGIFMTDSTGSFFKDFNKGMPKGTDWRAIKGMALTKNGQLFAVSQYGLFSYDAKSGWRESALSMGNEQRLSDITTVKGKNGQEDLIITGRNYVYIAKAPYNNFKQIQLKTPSDFDGKVSLFRTVWTLHSGELFGLAGRLIVDAIAIILIILIVTGLIYFAGRHKSRSMQNDGHRPLLSRETVLHSFTIHNKVGKATILLTLFIVISGWMLRPPGLIAIASGRIPAIPLSSMASANPWNDGLRALRYDEACHDWLLSSNKGFYSLKTLNSKPLPVKIQPEVSVMGINVLEGNGDGRWIVGSFSGLYYWDRKQNIVLDAFGQEQKQHTMPVSGHAITGLCRDFKGSNIIIDYNSGTSKLKMPEWMETMPMSLRNVALEIHTGRIYPFGFGGMLYIFLIGLALVWCLWSGWKIRAALKKH